mmetsp:Transcript_14136/g.33698  ORF Transcript_14136/g.33698 Transcript_14136/m.33698 type:complete len:211 (-) Transcript_14136:98-730(-)
MVVAASAVPAALVRHPSVGDLWVIEVEDAPGPAVVKHMVRQRLLHSVGVARFTALGLGAAVLTRGGQVPAVALHQRVAHLRHHLNAARILAHLLLALDCARLLHVTETGIVLLVAASVVPRVGDVIGLLEVIDTRCAAVVEHLVGQGFLQKGRQRVVACPGSSRKVVGVRSVIAIARHDLVAADRLHRDALLFHGAIVPDCTKLQGRHLA